MTSCAKQVFKREMCLAKTFRRPIYMAKLIDAFDSFSRIG